MGGRKQLRMKYAGGCIGKYHNEINHIQYLKFNKNENRLLILLSVFSGTYCLIFILVLLLYLFMLPNKTYSFYHIHDSYL